MNGTSFTYSKFKVYSDKFESLKCNSFSRAIPSPKSHACVNGRDLAFDASDSKSAVPEVLSNGSSHFSNGYDENFDVPDDEDVKTPGLSPTLTSPPHSDRKPHYSSKVESNSFVSSNLCDISCRPCQYPLDRLFDESVSIHPRLSFRNNLLHNTDKCTPIEKLPLSPRSFVNHPPLRRLEAILPCPLSPLPRLTSYSSSGSLIGSMSSMPFQSNDMEMDNILLTTLPPDSKSFMTRSTAGFIEGSLPNQSGKLSNHIMIGDISRSRTTDTVFFNDVPVVDVADSISAKNHTCADSVGLDGSSTALDALIPPIDISTKKSTRISKLKHSRQNKRIVSNCSKDNAPLLCCDPIPSEPAQSKNMSRQNCTSDSDSIPCSAEMEDSSDDAPVTILQPPVTESTIPVCVTPCSSPSKQLSSHIISEGSSNTPDEEFTLVVDKKHKRKQKLQMKGNDIPHQIHPLTNGLQSVSVHPNRVQKLAFNNHFSMTTSQPFSVSRTRLPQSRMCNPAFAVRSKGFDSHRFPVSTVRHENLNSVPLSPNTCGRFPTSVFHCSDQKVTCSLNVHARGEAHGQSIYEDKGISDGHLRPTPPFSRGSSVSSDCISGTPRLGSTHLSTRCCQHQALKDFLVITWNSFHKQHAGI